MNYLPTTKSIILTSLGFLKNVDFHPKLHFCCFSFLKEGDEYPINFSDVKLMCCFLVVKCFWKVLLPAGCINIHYTYLLIVTEVLNMVLSN